MNPEKDKQQPSKKPIRNPFSHTARDLDSSPFPLAHVVPDPEALAASKKKNVPTFTLPKKYVKLGSALLSVLIVIGGYYYFTVLPKHWDNSYTTAVTVPYQAQAAIMRSVYSSYGLPVFTINATSLRTENKNLAAANVAISSALVSTSSLRAANHLTILPGTGWLPQTHKTAQKLERMQQYIADSQALLNNYQTLTAYISNLAQIENKQVPQVVTGVQGVSTSLDPQSLLIAAQNASTSTSNLITSLNGLQPPADMNSFNSAMIKNFTTVNNALQGIINGVNNSDTQQIQTSENQLDRADNQLAVYSGNDIAGMLQTSSTLSGQMTKLKAENPLSAH